MSRYAKEAVAGAILLLAVIYWALVIYYTATGG